MLGPKFDKDAGKTAVIERALYGLKSAGAAFRSHLARCMEFMGYQSCMADTYLWLNLEIRLENGVKHYSYLLWNDDDIYASITMQILC